MRLFEPEALRRLQVEGGLYVFACGPWLGKLFRETIGDLIRPTKQDIFFFGEPSRHTPYHRCPLARVGRPWRPLFLRHPGQ